MAATKYSRDCHFFLNSTCSKGGSCQFRHEPQAKLTDVVCYFWKSSNCTRPNCPYRHSEKDASFPKLSNTYPPSTSQAVNQTFEKKVNKQCFWDKQPSGCTKRHCAYLHYSKSHEDTQPKEIVQEPATTSIGQTISSGSIILNKEKLHALKDIIPLGSHDLDKLEDDSKLRRVVVPPGTGILARREITGGIKTRLGSPGDIRKRLGSKEAELESEDNNREQSPDVEVIEELRATALRSIDLRNRIENKVVRLSESPEILRYESDNDQKRGKSKKAKKDKKEKKKKKKDKGKHKSKNQKVARHESDLPSASDYSDLETPAGSPDPTAITVMSRTSGMYADTSAVSKSAKIRLGKRKIEELDLTEIIREIDNDEESKKDIHSRIGNRIEINQKSDLDLSTRPRRGSLDASIDRNPSPPAIMSATSKQSQIAAEDTPSSRSPSPPSSSLTAIPPSTTKRAKYDRLYPPSPPDSTQKQRRHHSGGDKRSRSLSPPPIKDQSVLRSLYSRRTSPSPQLRARSPSVSGGDEDGNISPSKFQSLADSTGGRVKRARLSDEVMKVIKTSESDLESSQVLKKKKEKVKSKKSKKVKDKKRKKSGKKKRAASSASSPSPSPLPSPARHHHHHEKLKRLSDKKKKKKSADYPTSPLLDDPELMKQVNEFLEL
eukprot:TRINITY_DN13218_c0_g1_i6.p1 TRINITY_DN13218_c0_g1~~TRINITY_DN13218_c0_g1_i6.p1  ORF type:complete len:661 (+),score=161.31 TRINITY_DN13218_c0_g1_i6:30-2012(+)